MSQEEPGCKHEFLFQGFIYWHGDTRQGSGARDLIYGDRYYCKHCLKYEVINQRTLGNSYDKPIEGSMPM